ncbi:insulinase family protein [Streptomyces sp. NBC_00536]|uniref:M16 family metallopeptidase n=1 Tax=Streptomyces sp. NBC_00536 TaxID=2975769 RepID=UPI002E808DA8|nr:pitrilysin family protein [Streptomyces sp. NBC_00536]WUC82543.1 insulinase family protein [Streptomyces sp. NBC_00536]
MTRPATLPPPRPTRTLHPRPVPSAAPPWEPPPARTDTLGNGLRVVHLHRPGQRVIALELLLDAPREAEPRELEGIATLTARALGHGPRARDTRDFTTAIETCGATLQAQATPDGIRLAVQVPVSGLDRLLDLLTETLRSPAFTPHDVARLVRQRLDEIAHEQASPPRLAALTLHTRLYDDGQRAARPAKGSAETVVRIDSAAVRAFHDTHARPATATAVLVGDFTGVALPRLLESTLGRWVRPAAAPSRPPAPVLAASPGTVLVHRPGAVQTHLLIGRAGPGRHSLRWPAQAIALQCLGGPLTSRLDRTLREEKGYTYGISAFAAPVRTGAHVSVTGSVETRVTADAVAEIMAAIGSAAPGLTASEHHTALRTLKGITPMQYLTSAATARVLADVEAERLPAAYLSTLHRRLDAVTTDEATRELRAALPLDELVVVAVGDADAVEAGLRGLGPLTVLG